MTPAKSLFDCLRILDFEQGLQDVDKEIQAFKKKEVMNMEEMKNNVGNLTQITVKLEAALTELEVRVTALLQRRSKVLFLIRQIYTWLSFWFENFETESWTQILLHHESHVSDGSWKIFLYVISSGYQQRTDFAGEGPEPVPNAPNSDSWQTAIWTALDHSTKLSEHVRGVDEW